MCVFLLSFLPLPHHVRDLVGDLEASLQTDGSSRHSRRKVSWLQVMGMGGWGEEEVGGRRKAYVVFFFNCTRLGGETLK